MPAKADALSLLFHPKKNAVKKPAQSPSPLASGTPPNRKAPPTAPVRKSELDEDEDFKLPQGPFNEFKLLSSALNGWKYDVMKFDSRKPVEISTWQIPIKLNRKDLRRDDPTPAGPPKAVRPMLGPDGNQVFGPDGKPVMVDIEGRIVTDSADGTTTKPKKDPKKKFQKKTRQVFKVPEATRQLRREERYPWVLEDSSGSESWIAQLEDIDRAANYAFFMPAANDAFKFVPAHRWYKLQKKLKHDLPRDILSVESAYTMSQKRDPQAWLSQRNGKGPSDATAAIFKAESEGRSLAGSSSLVYDFSTSSGGGRKLKAVDSGMNNLFGDDDDDDGAAKRRREREYGGEGDLDENEFEEDFADDDDKMNVDDNDEELKELEERLKKEYKTANKTREGYIDESDEEDVPGKTKQEKAMQKLILKREGNDAYESDEDKNPYVSSEEEEEEEIPPPPPPAPPVEVKTEEETKPELNTPAPSTTTSHPNSPVSPTMGGHSVVAKRATSPKAPKLHPNNVSRGSSPLAGRSTSPPVTNNNSRATSPVIGNSGSRATSPVQNAALNGSQKKRKAEDGSPNGTAAPKPKKRKTPAGELEPRLLIEWLRNTPNPSTRGCIAHFQPYIVDEDSRKRLVSLVRTYASLKDGYLFLRREYRDGSLPPVSPAA